MCHSKKKVIYSQETRNERSGIEVFTKKLKRHNIFLLLYSGGGVGSSLPSLFSLPSGLGGLMTTLPSSPSSSPSSSLPPSASSGILGLIRPSPSSVLALLACWRRFRRRWRSVSALSRLRRTDSEPSLFSEEPPCKPSSMAAARSAISTSAAFAAAAVPSVPASASVAELSMPVPSSPSAAPSSSMLTPISGIFCPLATRTWCLSFKRARRRRSLWSLASGLAARNFWSKSSIAPVEAGDLGASESDDRAEGASGFTVCCLRRIEISLRRCWSSSWMFFSLERCEQVSGSSRRDGQASIVQGKRGYSTDLPLLHEMRQLCKEFPPRTVVLRVLTIEGHDIIIALLHIL